MSTVLSAPLHHLLAQLGPGGQAGADLIALHGRLIEAADAVAGIADRLPQSWTGAAATAAIGRLRLLAAALRELADCVAALTESVDTATGHVDRVRTELERLIAEFEARAEALAEQPDAAQALTEEAQHAQSTARGLVDGLRGQLGTAAPAASVASVAPPLSAPAGLSSFGAAGGAGQPDAVLAAHHREVESPDAAQFGAGEAVRLPDGTAVMAPNAVAAGAVRHALTQLGVPYQWGGTTAGVGLDCSGLTQWAYREAGLTIPRLAQEQDIGAAVDAGSLRPGDLAVWDGHVAMIVGNGTMIEAGDPVQLSPIRTTNAGQGFQGFWRPTA
ncbi:C40 family peptidase [Mycobacterium sp. C31M]